MPRTHQTWGHGSFWTSVRISFAPSRLHYFYPVTGYHSSSPYRQREETQGHFSLAAQPLRKGRVAGGPPEHPRSDAQPCELTTAGGTVTGEKHPSLSSPGHNWEQHLILTMMSPVPLVRFHSLPQKTECIWLPVSCGGIGPKRASLIQQ